MTKVTIVGRVFGRIARRMRYDWSMTRTGFVLGMIGAMIVLTMDALWTWIVVILKHHAF